MKNDVIDIIQTSNKIVKLKKIIVTKKFIRVLFRFLLIPSFF